MPTKGMSGKNIQPDSMGPDGPVSGKPRVCFRILVIDTMDWKKPYPQGHPFTDIGAWFRAVFQSYPEFRVKYVHWSSRPGPWRQFPFDVCVISGAIRSVNQKHQAHSRLRDWIHWCLQERRRVLGICYGHQLLAQTIGGTVGAHPLGTQIGNLQLLPTPLSTGSPIHEAFFSHAWLTSHVECVHQLPDEADILATSSNTSIQAFAYKNLAVGLQFHPEMNLEILKFLWQPHIGAGSRLADPEKIQQSRNPSRPELFPRWLHHWSQSPKT